MDAEESCHLPKSQSDKVPLYDITNGPLPELSWTSEANTRRREKKSGEQGPETKRNRDNGVFTQTLFNCRLIFLQYDTEKDAFINTRHTRPHRINTLGSLRFICLIYRLECIHSRNVLLQQGRGCLVTGLPSPPFPLTHPSSFPCPPLSNSLPLFLRLIFCLSASESLCPPTRSTPVLLPLACGRSDVGVLLVPGEEAAQCQGAAGPHRSRQHIELRAARPNQGAGAAHIHLQPLLQQVPGVVGQQGPLAHKLHTPFHLHLQLHLWLPRRGVVPAAATEFGRHGCWRREGKGVGEEAIILGKNKVINV